MTSHRGNVLSTRLSLVDLPGAKHPRRTSEVAVRSESRTAILLQRSKSNPIDVTVDHFVPGAVSLVANHTHRMRSIEVNLPSGLPEEVRSLLSVLAPILETMRMRGWGVDSWGPARLFPPYGSFFRGQFPTLRTLHLEGHPFDLARSTPMMTNSLTTLVLSVR
jgi:hypothetical protein